jgi:hypothetical protein
MINENIMTALILEDDADWDVEVHNIFQEFSLQMLKGELRSQRADANERNVAPYGMLQPLSLAPRRAPFEVSTRHLLMRPRYNRL